MAAVLDPQLPFVRMDALRKWLIIYVRVYPDPQAAITQLNKLRPRAKFTHSEEDEIIGCAALYPFPSDKAVELACLAVNPFYRDGGRGERILNFAEKRAKEKGYKTLFVLSTQTTQWFVERGFAESDVSKLPQEKQALYNYQRRSKIYSKVL